MNGTRVWVACELQSYRQVFAATFGELRPDVECSRRRRRRILTGRRNALDPDLVVCSRLTARVEDHTPSWVEPYPDSETHSVVSVLGEHSTVEKIQLSDLLAILDRAKRSSQPG